VSEGYYGARLAVC